jgi:hypothetical protein
LRASFNSAAVAILFCAIGALCTSPLDAQPLEQDTEAPILEPLESVEPGDGLPLDVAVEPGEIPAERAWGDWRVRIGALFLSRPHPPAWHLNDYLLYNNRIINAADLDFPIGPATDVSLRLPGSIVDLDFRYFGVSQAVARTGPIPGSIWVNWGRPFYNADPSNDPAQPSPSTFEIPFENRASLTSWLQSAELNLRREVHPSIALLAGFRYVQFREQWAILQVVPDLTWSSVTIARSELFGLQVGGEALLFRFQRLRLEGAAKAGVFGNSASSSELVSARIHHISIGASEDARRGAVAFVGDINLNAALQLTRSISLRGGYQLLWLAGVATATDQLKGLKYPLATVTDGSTFFHGAMVGLECGW